MDKTIDYQAYFWYLWSFLLQHNIKLANKYCDDTEASFISFLKKIKCKTEEEVKELCNEVLNLMTKQNLILLTTHSYTLYDKHRN
jgi:hypothetical protein